MNHLLPDELWDAIAPSLPTHPPSPKGGRPRVPDRDCLRGILFVLREGARWQSLPTEMGCGSGSTCWRRFAAWTAAGVWDQAHVHLLAALGERGLLNLERAIVDSANARAQKGGRTPAPTPRIEPRMAVNAT
jgi:transposase